MEAALGEPPLASCLSSTDGVDLAAVCHALAAMCSGVMMLASSVMSRVAEVPDLVKFLLKSLFAATQHKFPNECRTVTGSLFFLRFVCPAVISPDKFGVIAAPPSRGESKALVLTTKAIQKLANGAKFGTLSPYMKALNLTLDALAPKMDFALQALLAVGGRMVSVARPLFPFHGKRDDELSFEVNQMLDKVKPTSDMRWLHGRLVDSDEVGFFPTSMVEVHSELIFDNQDTTFLPHPTIGGKTPEGVLSKADSVDFIMAFVATKQAEISAWFNE